MIIERVESLYFSPTGNVKRVCEAIGRDVAEKMGAEYSSWDFTLPDNRGYLRDYGAGDLVVLGLPVYAGRIPNKIRPFVCDYIKGNNTKMVLVCCFGNRSFGDAMTEMRDLAIDNNFFPVSAAAVVGEHAFAEELGKGRPDEGDMAEIAGFASDVADKLINYSGDSMYVSVGGGEEGANDISRYYNALFLPGSSPAGPYYTPLRADGKPAVFLKAKPKTGEKLCNNCGTCADVCPMGSISRTDFSDVSGVCIKCQACVKYCSRGAKYFDDEDYLSHRQMLLDSCTIKLENKFFI